MPANRREQLQEFLGQNPNHAFARYGLGVELMRAGDTEAALEQFRLLHAQHPDYAAGYQQAGQLLLSLGRKEEARAELERGVAAAVASGDRHAASEIQGLLSELAT